MEWAVTQNYLQALLSAVAHGNTQAEHFRLLLLKELSPTDLVHTQQLAARYIQEYQPK